MADQTPMPIAIVGVSCRLPGDVSTPGAFYRMLCRKRSGWSEIPSDRFTAKAYHHPNPDKKGCLNSQGGYFLKDDISMFDAAFFDITKKEAESMDPAQRLLLECAYEALENGGIPKESVSGKRVGVFVGANYNEHRVGNLRDLDHIPSFDATGGQGAFLAGRLAYYFNLRGPTFTVDTACSSSMHALHLAVQSIRAGESEQAIVGASHLITHPDIWVSMGKLRLFSDAGKTYAFDHRAKSGYARGEGAGCLVLKPLARAQEDNDHVFAVITHTGISHNGRTVGIVAPSPDEQEQLLRKVFEEANINPLDVGFFEAHGTGTKKGDPIEATAIYKAVGCHFTPQEPLYIGSVKPNVGHLECASGIVSVIKAVLMVYYRFILPNTDFEQANEAIPLDQWNMRVATMQRPWPAKRKYACVNNFGFSGSNSTCILTAAPPVRGLEIADSGVYFPLRLFVLTANDEAALRRSATSLGIWLEQHAELYQTTMPRNLAYTLCQRRSHLPWRVAVVGGMCAEVATALNSHETSPARAPSEPPRLAFVYTGQGAQWFAMGRELLNSHPVFFDAISRADAALRAIDADFSILEELRRDKTDSRVGLAHISQPICSAVQLALTDLLRSFGITPSAVTGHSSGEIAAAYAAGALTFESAMAAAYYRGQVIVELKRRHPALRGSMMAVGAGAKEVGPMLEAINGVGAARAVVACENSPSSTTLSGDEEAIDRAATVFQEMGLFNRKLFVDVAYHSPHMKLIAASYLASVSHIQVPEDTASSDDVQFYSSLRGRKVSLSELGPEYWVENLTQTVRFATSLDRLCTEFKPDVLLEVGPHAALKGPIMQTLKTLGSAATNISYLPTLVRGQDATRTCLETAAQLFLRRYPLNFFEINHHREESEKPELIPSMYTYPWSRQKYWYESRLSQQHRLKPFARHDLLGVMADWSSDLEPTWRNVIRTEDLPWLKEYQVRSRMVFPTAGFMSMVVEAAAQNASLKGLHAVRFEIHNLEVVEHLFLADDKEFEVLLNLRAAEGGENGRCAFRISSYEGSRGWLLHCMGAVAAEPALQPQPRTSLAEAGDNVRAEILKRFVSEGSRSYSDDSSDASSSSWKAPSSLTSSTPNTIPCSDQLCVTSEGRLQALASSGADAYERLGSLSMSYPQCFQSVVEVVANGSTVTAQCCVRDTVSQMPLEYETPYKLHPSLLDAMLQTVLLGLETQVEAGANMAYLPSAIRHVTVRSPWSKGPGESFSVCSTSERRAGTFMVELFSTPGSAAANVSIAGLEFKTMMAAAPEPVAPRELCFRLDWEPLKQREPNGCDADTAPKSRTGVVIVSEAKDASKYPLVAALSRQIQEHTGVAPRICPLRAIDDATSSYVVMLEPKKPLLCSITEPGLEQIKKLLTTAPGLLWVTRGATRFPTTPFANLALGLIRTARSERSAVASTLDLDPNSQLDVAAQAGLILDAFIESVLSQNDDAEMEFAEDNGTLVVPRIAVDGKANLDIHRSLGRSARYQQDFHQPGRRLCLAPHGYGGSVDDLYFEDAPSPTLADDEVEIAVAASVLSQDDISSSGGNDANLPIARSCSGTVTGVGCDVRSVSVGSRVCALAKGPFGTHARARASSVAVIPPHLSMEAAACIPGPYASALYALDDVAGVRPGENLLIQLSGPEAVAAVQVARCLGASTYALVHSEEQGDIARRAGVAPDHILDARSIYLRQQVDQVTEGDGMEVVLTLSGVENGRAWECLADFGRFVEIRTSRAHRSTRAELRANATFASVNMMSIDAGPPEIMERTLGRVMENLGWGSVKLPRKATIVSVSELSRGLQAVRGGAVQPVVASASQKDQVKALHRVSTSIFRHDGTHVIVGGTGGLGRSMAKYMVDHGARTIVLLSRSGGGRDVVEKLQREMQCPETRVVAMKCDVSVEEQVWEFVKNCQGILPPICGVIHAAMVLRDVLLEGMTHEDFRRVIRPKVNGAWNMHKVLAETEIGLDYFVVLSSAAGILGSRGQGAYAAANTFLDSLMQFRVRNGLPGTALDLTAVTGAGYLAENAERQEDIIRNFGETVSEDEVLSLLSAAVRGVCGPQCLTGLRLHLGSDGQWPYFAGDPRFINLKARCLAAAEREGLVPKQAVSPGNAFRAAKSNEEAANIAAQGILHKLSDVLTVAVQNLDVARNITSYGLDSLTAIELRNWIAKELRANLQILELLSSGTIHDLAALIVQKTRAG